VVALGDGASVTCIVCNRPKAQHLKVSVVTIDGVDCRVCDQCEVDIFRRKRAVEIAKGLPRSCDCESCKLRENGGGRQLVIPSVSHE
jgi:hypothetical protein